jgi:DNA-binding beta-propeller fold protein YncE
VSTIDVTERTKNPTDITVGSSPGGMALTRDGKTALVGNTHSDTGVDDRHEDQNQAPR